MLLELRDFIRREKLASTQQMARALQVDEDALKPMLEFWLRKGLIKKCQEQAACGRRCSSCKIPPDYYQLY